ncbi:MAG: bifunctional demethylmenaquinone methyltransferase/2-methoxy-6-polyprenyl-1,4-benzoquinol methylase UbiE [Bacteroidales bacterium]
MDKILNKDRAVISSMFNSIAGKYDLLNHLLSLGIDKIWRRKLVKFVKSKRPGIVLDLACGTGDLTIALYKAGLKVIGMDIAEGMIDVAKAKCSNFPAEDKLKPEYLLAPAELIPLEDKSVDAVTIAFGIRNFENRNQSFKEIKRVLKSNGYLAILEFATPKNLLWKGMFNIYFFYILPLIGKIISKDSSAYSYLPESVMSFPKYDQFCKELVESGFTDVRYKSLTGGVALLYTARRADN